MKRKKEILTIGDLTPDPKNARKHNPRNIDMIEKSLQEVGAARSIVIDEDGNILAGNGTVEAAGAAGIENVLVVKADGNTIVAVQRDGLTAKQKKRLALYDNRTAELAEWDAEVMGEFADDGILDGLFAEGELDALSDMTTMPTDGEGLAGDNYGDGISSKNVVPINILGIGGNVPRDAVQAARDKLEAKGADPDDDNGALIADMFRYIASNW